MQKLLVRCLSDKQRDPENYQWLPSEPEGQITKRVSIPNRRLLQDYVTDAPRFTNQMTETLGPKQPKRQEVLLKLRNVFALLLLNAFFIES